MVKPPAVDVYVIINNNIRLRFSRIHFTGNGYLSAIDIFLSLDFDIQTILMILFHFFILYLCFACAQSTSRVLVILAGNIRGGPYAWQSLDQHLIKFYNAELALIGPELQNFNQEVPFNTAKYVWHLPDPSTEELGNIFDSISNSSLWRQISTSAEYLGGLPGYKRLSAALMRYTRYIIGRKIEVYNLASAYDWFVYTRSDFLYMCPPAHLEYLSKDFIYAPDTSDWGGVNDRHWVIPADKMMKAMNEIVDITANASIWIEATRTLGREVPGNSFGPNSEAAVQFYFRRVNLQVKLLTHTGMTVKREVDPTRQSNGHIVPELMAYGLRVKYLEEYDTTLMACTPYLFHSLQTMIPPRNVDRNQETIVVSCPSDDRKFLLHEGVLHQLRGEDLNLIERYEQMSIDCFKIFQYPFENPI